jgi:outer membrane protein TolC
MTKTSVCIALSLITVAAGASAQTLSLSEAERLATGDDPVLQSLEAQASALGEQAVAEGQLPDPTLRLALANFPTDTFDFQQERMTQIQFGVQQAFPPGDSRAVKTELNLALAAVERANGGDQARKNVVAVRTGWLEAFHWIRAQEILDENSGVLENIIEVTRSLYSTGRENSQDVLSAELESSLLDDRRIEALRMTEKARAELAKWIGSEAAARALPSVLPELPRPPPVQQLLSALVDHPRIKAAEAIMDARKADVELARQQFKPSWTLGAQYGLRGDEINGQDTPDFLSVIVSLSAPLFTERRQDKRLSASQLKFAAARLQRDDALRELRRMLEADYSAWQRLNERVALYDQAILSRADQTLEAALGAYQSDVTDFSTLMRAQSTELETRLKALRVRIDRAQTQAKLLYLKRGTS